MGCEISRRVRYRTGRHIMKSIRNIYKIGKGPSSSHTMGPFKAVRHYMEHHPDVVRLHVTLFGSLAATGKGHLTDIAIEEAFATLTPSEKSRFMGIYQISNRYGQIIQNAINHKRIQDNGFQQVNAFSVMNQFER